MLTETTAPIKLLIVCVGQHKDL